MSARRQAAERRGRWAELLAASLLTLKFYRILGWRVRTKAGEIDLVARSPGGILCFIEVKHRAAELEAILSAGPRQQARIARAAELYIARYPRAAAGGVRFDLISVAGRGWPRHLRDAFRPGR